MEQEQIAKQVAAVIKGPGIDVATSGATVIVADRRTRQRYTLTAEAVEDNADVQVLIQVLIYRDGSIIEDVQVYRSREKALAAYEEHTGMMRDRLDDDDDAVLWPVIMNMEDDDESD